MADYDNTNSGALFLNDRKEADKHPDYRGTINVDGVEYWINAWVKTSKKGDEFFSLAVKPKEQPAAQAQRSVPHKAQPKTIGRGQPQQRNTGGDFGDMDDDIPF